MPKGKRKRPSAATRKRAAAARLGWRRRKRRLARQRAKRRAQRKARTELKAAAAKRGPGKRTEEWEVTIRYSKRGRALGITVRVVAPAGSSRDVILLVVQRAGMSTEKGFQVHMTDWQQELHGRTRAYGPYDPQEVLGWTSLLKAAIAAGTMRAERVGT